MPKFIKIENIYIRLNQIQAVTINRSLEISAYVFVKGQEDPFMWKYHTLNEIKQLEEALKPLIDYLEGRDNAEET